MRDAGLDPHKTALAAAGPTLTSELSYARDITGAKPLTAIGIPWYNRPQRIFSEFLFGGRMLRSLGLSLLLVGSAAFAFGAPVPEIGVGSAGSAIALLSGAVLIFRGRRK